MISVIGDDCILRTVNGSGTDNIHTCMWVHTCAHTDTYKDINTQVRAEPYVRSPGLDFILTDVYFITPTKGSVRWSSVGFV